MRNLSLSFIALAVLALAPASDAQQISQIRKANIQAKSQKMTSMKNSKAKSFARLQAWQKNLVGKSQKNATRTPSNVSLRNKTQGVAGKAKNKAPSTKQFMRFDSWKKNVSNKSKSMKAIKVRNHSKAAPKTLKQEFGKRYKIKQAVKAALGNRQKAMLKGKASMSHKQR